MYEGDEVRGGRWHRGGRRSRVPLFRRKGRWRPPRWRRFRRSLPPQGDPGAARPRFSAWGRVPEFWGVVLLSCRLRRGTEFVAVLPRDGEVAGAVPGTKGRGSARLSVRYQGGERGVCIKAVGFREFKGEGYFADETCDGMCGGPAAAGSSVAPPWGTELSWLKRTSRFKCKDDWDCSLSGLCVRGTCQCDAWATGLDCSYLNLAPIDKSRLGYLHSVHTSWGGNAVKGLDGKWHMYVSEIICGKEDLRKTKCGLARWQTQSQVVHTVSSTIDGPYQRQEVVIKPEAHNPTLQVSPVDGSWNLYYISDYDGPIEVIASEDGGRTWTEPTTVSRHQNPGPMMLPDGTVTMFYRGDGGNLPSPTCSSEYVAFQSCPSRTEPCSAGFNRRAFDHTAEDPSIFVDLRGNYHMLVNALPYMCVPKEKQGGHAWSRDGVRWSEPRVGAFDATLKFRDGSSVTCERRERPQMMLQAEPGRGGKPVALVSAVTGCPREFGANYKGGDDSFTLVQLLQQ